MDRYRVEPGSKVRLADYPTDDTGDFKSREEAEAKMARDIERLAELQERLYAENTRALLIVLQAMDTGGKDGKCVDNPCAKVECKSGEVCDPETGMCRANKCAFITCGANLACCQEECRADPCVATMCPEGAVCRVDQLTCKPDCVTKPALQREEIVTAGGAFSCAVGRRDRALDSRLAALALALLLGLAARRRRL